MPSYSVGRTQIETPAPSEVPVSSVPLTSSPFHPTAPFYLAVNEDYSKTSLWELFQVGSLAQSPSHTSEPNPPCQGFTLKHTRSEPWHRLLPSSTRLLCRPSWKQPTVSQRTRVSTTTCGIADASVQMAPSGSPLWQPRQRLPPLLPGSDLGVGGLILVQCLGKPSTFLCDSAICGIRYCMCS